MCTRWKPRRGAAAASRLKDRNSSCAEPAESKALDQARTGAPDGDVLNQRITAALRTVSNREVPVNIYDLGLVYELDVSDAGVAHIRMTLTAPGCPVAQTFPGVVESPW